MDLELQKTPCQLPRIYLVCRILLKRVKNPLGIVFHVQATCQELTKTIALPVQPELAVKV